MAEDARRRLIRGVLSGIALAAVMAASAFAQPVAIRSPGWSELSPAEKQILAPLAPPEWEKLDAARRQKWRGIAKRYPTMSPEEQQRTKQQMRQWAELTPKERAAAREQYKSLKALPPDKKQDVHQKWQEYQSLPPETKRELAAKPVPAAAPSATGGKQAVRPAPPQAPPPQLAPGAASAPK